MSEYNNMKNDLSELLQLVSFKIGKEEFGVDILKVQEIIKIISITKVPNSPHFVEGVINLRGRVIPIIDLRVRLGLEKIAHTNDTRIVVVDLVGNTVGFIVDEVNEVLRISKSITEAPPELVTGIDSDYITAVGKLEDRILILLDLEKILSQDEKEELAANKE
jgi:purine-binding chemotaxis protein CheW